MQHHKGKSSCHDTITICIFIREKTALWYVHPETNEDIKLSFEELSTASKKAANAVKALGVRKMVCILPKVPEWWIVNVGTIRSNTILLPGTTQLQVTLLCISLSQH